MNSDRAFEQHTDLVRALNRPGSPERAWWDESLRRRAYNALTGVRQTMVAVGDFDLIAALPPGTGGLTTHVLLGTEPQVQASADHEDLIGVIDPDRLHEALQAPVEAQITDGVPQQVALPLDVFTDLSARQLAAAPTIYVTRDMVTLLEHAAAALDDTDFMPRHPAYPTGFAVLARPIRIPYGDGTSQVIDAFGWTNVGQVQTRYRGVGQGGFIFEFANKRAVTEDREITAAQSRYPSARAWKDAPDLVLNITDTFVAGASVGPPTETSEKVDARREVLREVGLTGGTTLPPFAPGQGPSVTETVGRFQPYLAALLLLLAQEITTTRREQVHEFAVRRASRAGRSRSHVTVVDIRHRTRTGERGGATSGEREHERLHERHLVGGHWKWQAFGPQARLRKRIFVAAYIRGPEDAPLRSAGRVIRL